MTRTILSVLGLLGLSAAYLARGQNTSQISGGWTISGPVAQSQVQLSLQRTADANSEMSSSFPVPLAQLRGVTRTQMDSSGVMVRFELARDAGTLRFEGYVQAGVGGGAFTFSPNSAFATEMRSLGYADFPDEKLFVVAVHDVSIAWVRDLNALGVHAESADQLIAMRIHNVGVDYVRDFKDLGYQNLRPDQLVTMRIHAVTPDFARELKGLRYDLVSPDQLITMQIHGASVSFIKELSSLGYNHPAVEQLVTMCIHGISPDYVRKVRSLGLGSPTIDQLVSLKIHGVVD